MTDYEAYLKQMEAEKAESDKRIADLWRQQDRNFWRMVAAGFLLGFIACGLVVAALLLLLR